MSRPFARRVEKWSRGGYFAAYRISSDNLKNGLSVVADSVNPIEITRKAWRDVAVNAGVEYREIEIVCSSLTEHRQRVETRAATVAGLKLPTWKAVQDRCYEPWKEATVFDTAAESLDESTARLMEVLRSPGF